MAAIHDGTAKFWLGSQNTEETYYNAEAALDEARVSDVARPADWILAEYNNQNDPSAFYAVGEEGAPVASKRRAVVAMLHGDAKREDAGPFWPLCSVMNVSKSEPVRRNHISNTIVGGMYR
jgi:hypothetical protein